MQSFKKIFLIWLLLYPIYVTAEIVATNQANYLVPYKLSGLPSDQKAMAAQKQFRTRLLISGFVLSTALYGATAWWKDSSSEFQVRHEGWFGKDTPNGGADKLGHAYSFYVSTRLMKSGFEWAGYKPIKAAQLAGITSATLSIGVEIMDGFTEKYGFSNEDMIMNLSGIGIGVLLESYPHIDKLIDVRLQYWPSDDAKRLNDYDPLADYSGQTYLLIAKASGVPILRKYKLLRYLELAVGYGTRGYQPTDGTGMQPTERNVYYGLSLNLSQLLSDTVFKNQQIEKNHIQKVTKNVLEYLQMPGTALLFKNNL